MKKIAAFLMAFALCVACLGTYGFADVTNPEHGHNHVVEAANTTDELFINKERTYSTYTRTSTGTGATGRLVITLVLGPSKLGASLTGEIGVRVTAKTGVLDLSRATVTGTLFGTLGVLGAPVTSSGSTSASITFAGINASAGTSAGSSGITISIPVLGSYGSATVNPEEVLVEIGSYDIVVDSSARSYSAYVCAHTSTTVKTTNATCQANGKIETVCTVCRAVLQTQLIISDPEDLSMHVYDYTTPIKPYTYKAPTCTQQGSGGFKCTLCGIVREVAVPKSEHNYSGRTLISGVYYETCTTCGERQVAANQCGHSKNTYEFVRQITASTCQVAGEALYKCVVAGCGQTETRTTPLADHQYDDGRILANPTCTEVGAIRKTCQVCGTSSDLPIAPTDHEYGEWTVTKIASCVEKGTETQTCTKCGQKNTREVAGTGHEYGEWLVTIPASCTSTGINTSTCRLCGDKKQTTTPVIDHTWSAWETVLEPTCVAAGKQKRMCRSCYVEDEQALSIVPENHSFGEWETVTAKTCLEDGVKSRTCTLCQKEETEVDPKVGHIFGEPLIEGKVSTKTCGVCAYREQTKTVKNGIEKTLITAASGSLTITGADVVKNYVFDLTAPTVEKEAYYRDNLNFAPYRLDQIVNLGLEIEDAATAFTPNMELALNISPSLGDYEVKLYRLTNGAVYPIYEFDRKDGQVIIPGNELVGAECLFVVQGEEAPGMNIALLAIIAVLSLVVIGGALYVFLLRNKKQELF